jgi:TIR domain
LVRRLIEAGMPAEPNADRARIYVSFADEDRARAMELVRWLNDSGWQVAADDRHAFAPGEIWSPPPRLSACDVILCVITPGWLVSTYCHHEFAYCAKRGKFTLPVVCEPFDLGVLPQAVRALPRIDLTRHRMIDYLALKEALTQAGSQVGRASAAESDAPRKRVLVWGRGKRRALWLLLLALLLLTAIVAIWFWTLIPP